MRNKLFIPLCLLGSFFMEACSEPTHPDAENLCGCYNELYRTTEENLETVSDSCSAIHISILNKLKENPEEKEKFEEAYAACQ